MMFEIIWTWWLAGLVCVEPSMSLSDFSKART